MNGVHIPFPERFPSLRHFTELPSEPTVERVSKVTPATDQIEGDQHGTEAKEGQQSGLVSKGFKRNKSALADLTYPPLNRSEEHTSELQSLMRISYAVFCLKKKKHVQINTHIY